MENKSLDFDPQTVSFVPLFQWVYFTPDFDAV